MDYKVIWSPEAMLDIKDIAEYIERDSKFYAKEVVTKITRCSQRISLQPYSGRIVPEADIDNLREKFVYSYRVIYEIFDDKLEIQILAVIHGARLLENALDESRT